MKTDYCAFRVTLHTQRLVGRGFKYPSVFLRFAGAGSNRFRFTRANMRQQS